ncbi:hypothetical protein M5X00_06140 [Paenibacillus alvei]|uniref:Lipoprotein n=1 Tax=Paenibacillus alvei TaxID=44250 RepID=A0ABT4GXM4_PAEAL|nr:MULTISPECIES: hypothetical protein [Paenibacillus]EJW20210.1 hypothetical protein PAV_1c12090 [Paenibacillus alvei DSM 29]MCY9539581.1 hypothetical protein [Paenibacillus alvei]MCY9704029.1 hypothetical protein [Paenibacillus alvei]MCY9734026.1 hypothetical protein [Paenibacillus alvei]MCY9753836.1 hypothetical protein [Paenibacillus alvei]
MNKSFTLLPILFILIFLNSGCSSSEQSLNDEYNAETDYPYMFHAQGIGALVTTTQNGYYMLDGSYIYYADKPTMKPVLLDNRPDHSCLISKEKSDENCNAYVANINPLQTKLLQYYKGHLYTIESRLDKEGSSIFQLVQLNLDGTNRKVVKTFPNAMLRGTAIHRGNIYYGAIDFDLHSQQQYQVLRLPIDNLSQEPEVLYSGKFKQGSITDIVPYGSQVYMNEFTDKGYRALRYDLATSILSSLWEKTDGGFASLGPIHKNRMYFNYYYPADQKDDSDITDPRGLKIYSSDLKGEHIQETDIKSSPIISTYFIDDRYTYVRPVWFQARNAKNISNEMKIYKNKKEVHKVDMSLFSSPHYHFVGDDRYMFVIDRGDENYTMYLLDKNEIETGKASFQPFIESPLHF